MNEEIKARGESMLAAIVRIRELTKERDKLLAELEAIAALMASGVDPAQVEKWYGNYHSVSPDGCPVYHEVRMKGEHGKRKIPRVWIDKEGKVYLA